MKREEVVSLVLFVAVHIEPIPEAWEVRKRRRT